MSYLRTSETFEPDAGWIRYAILLCDFCGYRAHGEAGHPDERADEWLRMRNRNADGETVEEDMCPKCVSERAA